jgi:hypothetical protein
LCIVGVDGVDYGISCYSLRDEELHELHCYNCMGHRLAPKLLSTHYSK